MTNQTKCTNIISIMLGHAIVMIVPTTVAMSNAIAMIAINATIMLMRSNFISKATIVAVMTNIAEK